jgi:hypothetical protein
MDVGTASAAPLALWNEFAAAPYTHPQIPDVSFAGYRHGAALPRAAGTHDVLAYGAKPDGSADSATAINNAISAAGQAGGGVVLIPAGTYRLDKVVQLGYSNVVLRGAGSARTVLKPTRSLTDLIGAHVSPFGGDSSAWSWTGGLVWVSHRDRYAKLVADIKAKGWAEENWTGTTLYATLTADAKRGDFSVTVNSTSQLSVGKRVVLRLDNNSTNDLLKHMSGDIAGASTYNWSTRTKLLSYSPFTWPVRIAAISGKKVTFDQPLPLDARVGWKARLTSVGPVVVDAGVEGLTISLPLLTQQKHLHDKGFNGLLFQCAWDCWADDVKVVNADNAILLTCAKGVTLSRTRVSGRARHHSYACRQQSHDNLFSDFAIELASVPPPSGSAHHGINVEGLSSGNAWSAGRLENGTFDTHRGLPFGNVRTQITINNDSSHGGSSDAGPLYGARFTHWNITVTNERANGIKIDGVAPKSATVGISQVRDFGQVDQPDFTGALGSRLASYGTTAVDPPNLYLAQRQLRLGSPAP